MKEIPILFSGPMVKAILEGRKTQTRRVVKTNPSGFDVSCYSFKTRNFIKCHELEDDHCAPCGFGFQNESTFWRCPYGQPGDRLWVRETGWERSDRTPKMMREGADTWARYYFDADGLDEYDHEQFKVWGFKRRPSIFMPRWASRITLEITGVRVERLNEISREDAKAEGLWPSPGNGLEMVNGGPYGNAQLAFRALWESINGPGSWDANPFVWVIEFRRVN